MSCFAILMLLVMYMFCKSLFAFTSYRFAGSSLSSPFKSLLKVTFVNSFTS